MVNFVTTFLYKFDVIFLISSLFSDTSINFNTKVLGSISFGGINLFNMGLKTYSGLAI